MDIYCPKCREPWEMDSIHDEVSRRHPNKPWYVEDKPVQFNEPDKIMPWCDFIIGRYNNNLPQRCYEREDHAIHTEHAFVPQIEKSYKVWNSNPFIDRNTGLWYDEYIYSQHYEPVRKEFQVHGCTAFGMPHNKYGKDDPAIGVIYEMMGDDMDGAASMIEDAQQMGLME